MNADTATPADIAPGQPYVIDRFRPKDADGVARLFRSVYGDGYPVATYLAPDRLIRENDARRIISSVARTPCGDIVGHNALFNSAAHPGTYESGAGVVHAAYRGGKGIFTEMVRHGLDWAGTLPDVNLVFGEPVCNHSFSQRLVHNQGFVTRALEVDLMPAAAYRKEASAAGRVAAFLAFKTLRANPHAVYLPTAYAAVWPFLYAGLDDRRDLHPAEAAVPADARTDMRPQIFDFAAVARVAVPATGPDFTARVASLEADLAARDIVVTQIWLNLAEAWIGQAVETLRARGYFLGGVLQRWFDSDGLLMQKIRNSPDWDGILAHGERAQQILDLVRDDWRRSIKEDA